MYTTPPMTPALTDATIYFDARANQALERTRTAWVALGDLLSGEPVLPGALEQATARYHEALMQLGLQALRTSYLNPPSLMLVDLPAMEEAGEDEERAQAPAAPAVQVRRAPSPPAQPARPKAPDAQQARQVEPEHAARIDHAQLLALKAQLGKHTSWADEARADTHAAEAARALDAKVRELCIAGVKGWKQGQAALLQLGALVRDPRRWHILDSADRVELLSALAAMIRHIGLVPLPRAQHTARSEQIKATLTCVHQARRDSVDGFVHGLGKDQSPRYGGDWWQDARHILGVDAAKPAAKTVEATPAPCSAQQQDEPVVEAPPRANPYPHLKGQRWALVGGDRRGERGEAFSALLELKQLEWIDSTPGKHKHIGNVLKRMKHGSLDAVVVLKQFINHSATNKLVEAGKKHGVTMIWVDGGYGEQQLLTAIARYAPAR